jgi:hypothetical protein
MEIYQNDKIKCGPSISYTFSLHVHHNKAEIAAAAEASNLLREHEKIKAHHFCVSLQWRSRKAMLIYTGITAESKTGSPDHILPIRFVGEGH